MSAPTTRETADHIGEANEKVVQTPMHRDSARPTIALKVSGRADHIGDATTMIEHAELKRLAEDMQRHTTGLSVAKFRHAANPATVLALLSEIAALRGRENELIATHAVAVMRIERQRDEAWGLLRELADGRSQKSNINEYDDLSVRASTLLANQGADQ